ncbi:MAG: acyl-CoA dehydrogenase family protein [Deltaproteobacteria bacterium]|nr:acyl-CoA dehydrogenase family protein [Deltaproteobacteria bacterium]
MPSFLTDNQDLTFYLERGLDLASLARFVELDFRDPDGPKDATEAVETYREVLALVGKFVAEEVAPRSRALDREPPKVVDGEVVPSAGMVELFDRIKALGLHAMGLPRELEGLNQPLFVYMIATELFARADVSVMAHLGFHGNMALAMLLYSLGEGSTRYSSSTGKIESTRFQAEILEIARGLAWGSMDITEPDAGSDMAALRTKGELVDGRWIVSGQKIFITSGHGKYHFVIARTEPNEGSTAGLGGLSLFLVPAYEDTPTGRTRFVAVDRVEEKLGMHASATCAVTFDRSPAHLLGKRGDGFRQMLLMMNGARLAVGFEAIGLAEAALRGAKAYAAERRSMGKTIDRHEMIADDLELMETEIQGLRALAMDAGIEEELALRKRTVAQHLLDPMNLERARLLREADTHKRRARLLTPLLKYQAAEKAVAIARRCLQIHGGNGYTTDFGAEKLLRDALVMPIYEGTSQIQALMAMKDNLGAIIKAPQEFVARTAQARWQSLSARDPEERRVAKLRALACGAEQHLITRTAADRLRVVVDQPVTAWGKALTAGWEPKRDFAFAMLHAARLTELLADAATAEILLAQGRRFPERRELLERFLERAEPRARALHDEITTTGERLLKKLAEPDERAAAR